MHINNFFAHDWLFAHNKSQQTVALLAWTRLREIVNLAHLENKIQQSPGILVQCPPTLFCANGSTHVQTVHLPMYKQFFMCKLIFTFKQFTLYANILLMYKQFFMFKQSYIFQRKINKHYSICYIIEPTLN